MGGLLALLELPVTSLVSLQRLLADGQFRRSVADRLADPVVRAFWQREFAGWKPQYQAEAIAPIQNPESKIENRDRKSREADRTAAAAPFWLLAGAAPRAVDQPARSS